MNRRELKEKRTRNSKLFENQDHSFTREIYLDAVHYEEDGSWKEMDDTLEEGPDEGSALLDQGGEAGLPESEKSGQKDFVNKKGLWKVRFSNKYKKQGAVILTKDRYQISWAMEGAEKVKARKNGAKKLIYPGVMQDVDIHLRVSGENVKEDIIRISREAPEGFCYIYQMKDLDAVQDGNRVAFVNETGEEIFAAAAPLMKDADGNISEAVTVTLEKGQESCRIRFTPDKAWMEAPERSYPVVIDPVITSSTKAKDIQDAHVDSRNCGTNFFNSIILKTMGGDNVQRSFLKFKLPSLESAEMVINASFGIGILSGSTAQRTVQIHRVLQDWDSRTITWNNKPVYEETVQDSCTYQASKDKWISFDITRMVKEWYQKGRNFGLMMKDDYELAGYTEFLASDCDDSYAELRPRIDITYVNYTGLEDYWTYHSQNVGRAGTIHINDYNGNLILERALVSTSGSRMPAAVGLVYNTNDRKKNLGCGYGFRLNYHQTLEKVKIGTIDYYKYTDGDGTVHYFYKNDKGVWKDESGLELTLTMKTSGTEPLEIRDKEENTMLFDSSGHLVKVRDKNANVLTITYSSDRITKVTDGAGKVITLTYAKDSNGKLTNLSEMTDPFGRKILLTYSGGQIVKILDWDGESSSYSYNNSLHLLKKATDPDGYGVQYEYTETDPYRVTKITEYSGSTEGNSLTLIYGYNSTAYVDKKGRKEVSRFNDQGNLLHIHDGFGHAAGSRFSTKKGSENRLENTTKLQNNIVQLLKDPILEAATCGWTPSADTATAYAKINTDPANVKVGSRSLEIGCSDDADSMCWKQTVQVKKGETYTFSMYVKTLVEKVGSNGRCFVRIHYYDKDGNPHNKDSAQIIKTTTDFIQLHTTYTIPADSAKDTIIVYLYLHHIKGKVYGDMAQLEQGTTPSRCNLVDNGDFHYGKTTGFRKTGTSRDGLVNVGEEVRLPIQHGMMVIKTSAPLYKSPDPASAQTGTASKNEHLATAFSMKGTDGKDWYYVKNGSGSWGYVQSGDVLAYLPNGNSTASGVVIPKKTYAVLRSRASHTSTPVEEAIPRGTCVVIRSKTTDADGNSWYRTAMQIDNKRYSGYLPGAEVLRFARNKASGIVKAPGAYYKRPGEADAAGTLAEGTKMGVRGVLYKTGGEKWYGLLKEKDYIFIPESGIELVEKPAVSSLTTTTVTEKVGGLDEHILKLMGEASQDKKLTKTLDLKGKKGDTYMANAWGRGTALPETEKDKKRRFGVEVTFVPAKTGEAEDVHYMKFSPDLTDWQFLSEACVAKVDYKAVKVAYTYSHNANLAFFDGLALFREEFGQTYTYDDKNNLISVTDAQKQAQKFEYNDVDDLTGIVDAKGNKFTFTYDKHHNVTEGKSAEGVCYQLKYDGNGNVVKSGCVEPAHPENGTWLTRVMDDKGNHVQSVTDAGGNKIEYFRDANDRLARMKDARGNDLTYGYDSMDRLTSVEQQVTSGGVKRTVRNEYTYEKDRLTKILHNGFAYGFGYDGFGNTTHASIAGSQIVSYEYEPGNGNLLKTTYGNGDTIRYTYDKQDRLTLSYYKKAADTAEQKLNGYVYDKHGNLAEVTSHMSGKTYRMSYDFLDRLMRVTDEQGTGYEYTYDVNNNMVRMEHSSGASAAVTSYTYDKDGREVTSRPASSYARTTAYDVLGRVKSQSWNTAAAFTSSYTYFDEGVNRYGLPKTVKNGTETLAYTYDPNGNIASIRDSAGTSTFVYDELNQLIRENNHILDKTIVYSYDLGGNLTEVKEYGFTTAAALSGAPVRTETGTYDAVWKDKLLNWNGTAMTYDEVGNMLTRGSTTFEWTAGRRLSGVENGKKIQYLYDHTGARVKKVVDGVATEYRMAGDLLLSEKTGTQTYWYRYDSGANLISVTIKGKIYFYVKNAQNDIIGLVDAEGNMVVQYSYDSWGKLLGITGSMADTIGVQNPFRYRGYYYDNETGMYYLKSRYYDPELRRFISIDRLEILEAKQDLYDKNLYAYCDNNAPARVDVDGNLWIAALIGAAVNVVSCGIAAKVTGQSYTGKDIFWAAVSGAASGWNPYAGGIASALVASVTMWKAGGSVLECAISGVAAFAGTTCVGNLSGIIGGKTLENSISASFGATFGTGGNLISAGVYAGVSQTRPSQPKLSPIKPSPVNRRYIGSGMKYNGRTGQRDYFKIYQTDKGEIYEEYV